MLISIETHTTCYFPGGGGGGGGGGPDPSESAHESHTFVEIDHEMISIINLLPSTDSRRAVVSYKRKTMHEVLVKAAESSLSVVR